MSLWKTRALVLALLVAKGCLLCVGALIGMYLPLFATGQLRGLFPAHIVFAVSCVALVAVSFTVLVALKCVQRKWWMLGSLLVGIAVGSFYHFVEGLSSGWSFVYR